MAAPAPVMSLLVRNGLAPAMRDGLRGHPLGWRQSTWFGVRVFTDHLDQAAPEPPDLEQLLAAEHQAATRDPYRQVAALLHLIHDRP